MTKYFKSYRRFFQKALNDDSTDLMQLMQYHKDHIQFFQHERFIHLIVMFLFAISTVIAFIVIAVTKEMLLIPLAIALLVLLVPYIKHYYFLENQTQALYHDYEKLHEKLYGFPADEDELK
jgi:hypothetical protein